MKGLVDGGLGVERQLGVDLSRDLARDDLQDLLAELNQETVQSSVDLLRDALAVLLAVGNGRIDECGILGLLGRGQDQGGVGGGILGLVLADGCDTLAHAVLESRPHSLNRDASRHGEYILAKSPMDRKLVASSMHASRERGGTYQSRRPRRCQWP